jgi:spermidine synthase
MTQFKAEPAAAPENRFLPVLLLLFVGSGCAALIYEIVWLQLLQLVIGSSAVSLGVLLGTFMGGMCLGSLLLPRFISSRSHPMRVYAFLEIGIGIMGMAIPILLPGLAKIYAANAGGHGFLAIALRGVVCGICLLPPTLLMGATLPAMARWVETNPRGISWMGFFYGGNIAGAVCGCLLAGFFLLRKYDMVTATLVAAAINGAVALVGLGLAMLTQSEIGSKQKSDAESEPAPGYRRVYFAIALSGMSALGAEVVWTRLLSLMMGGTVYTFSIILAVFLVGLGIGSSAGSFIARTITRPRVALGWCQLLLTAAIAWTAMMVARSIPYWPIDPSLAQTPWFNFQLDLARCFWAILPATCLWGASFPLALAAVAGRGQDPGRLVGGVYAANTVGAILGALVTSLLLIAWMGTQHAQQVLIGIAAIAAILALIPSAKEEQEPGAVAVSGISAAIAVVAGVVMLSIVPPTPWGLVAHGRYLATKGEQGTKLFMGEGINASVAVTELSDGTRNFHVSGKIEASTDPRDMRLQRMLGHIPALLHPQPKSVLIVGCGAGVTAGSFVNYDSIKRIVICEIEPLIPRVVATNFSKENYSVVTDPKVTVIYDDARNFIRTSKEKFDIITSDPIHPWVKGAATLYTREYFEQVKEHLNPGGLVTQWVPLYESRPEVVQSELATFFEAFPDGVIWSNDDNGKGYDTVAMGRLGGSIPINVDELQQRLDKPEFTAVARSLRDVQFNSAVDLLGTYAGRAVDIAPWLKRAEINRDRNLRLQYLAGMGANLYLEGSIFNSMEEYRKIPGDLFIATDETWERLRAAIERTSH